MVRYPALPHPILEESVVSTLLGYLLMKASRFSARELISLVANHSISHVRQGMLVLLFMAECVVYVTWLTDQTGGDKKLCTPGKLDRQGCSILLTLPPHQLSRKIKEGKIRLNKML